MANTFTFAQTDAVPDQPSRAAAIWLTAAQLVALALLALALAWAFQPAADAEHPAKMPSRALQALLALIALMSFVLALAPAWRRSAFSSALSGVALALACWLTAGVKTVTIPIYADIPTLAFIVPPAAFALLVWGLFARCGLKDASRLGVGTLVAGLGLLAVGAFFFFTLTRGLGGIPAYHADLASYAAQYEVLLANILLYPAALWVGSIGIRRQGGLMLQPLLTALAIGGALLWWNR